MIEWKDRTSYSRSETDRTPRSWHARAGMIEIAVHRHVSYAPDVWLLSCPPIADKLVLTSKDIDEAKAEAVRYVKHQLYAAIGDLT